MIQIIKGFRDILPEDMALWQKIETTAKELFENFGYKEIRIPILEKTELFARSVGENTDIVEKEMYTMPDGKRGNITLRPEATASIVRSYIQHKIYANSPVQKTYMIGPMFRRERPQRGRYRQFYQIDAEVFGIESPYIDAQIIYMLVSLFDMLSVPDILVHLNSLGCPACRPGFQKALLELLENSRESLCGDCQRRIDKNPLRVLDCKVESCRKAVENAPSILDFLCDACDSHFSTVKTMLNSQNIEFKIDKRLVRGLDYYTRTIFEIQTTSLGAQSAVAGGGRYDGLIKSLGGPDTPAIGFAIGFDRLAELLSQIGTVETRKPDIFLISLGEQSRTHAYGWSCSLNSTGIMTDTVYEDRSLKSQMKRADKLGASYVLITGDTEIENQTSILRDMRTKTQHEIPFDGLVQTITDIINKHHVE